jgi:hypothetical protein
LKSVSDLGHTVSSLSSLILSLNTDNGVTEGFPMTATDRITDALAEYEAQHQFARQVSLPVEDWGKYMPQSKWRGGYRWFRASNVVCLEKYRLLKVTRRIKGR